MFVAMAFPSYVNQSGQLRFFRMNRFRAMGSTWFGLGFPKR